MFIDFKINYLELMDIKVKDDYFNKCYIINNAFYSAILKKDKYFKKLISILRNNKKIDIVFEYEKNNTLKFNKIIFLKGFILYINVYSLDNRYTGEIVKIYNTLNYLYNLNTKEVYRTIIDYNKYQVLVQDYVDFLELNDEEFNKCIEYGKYKDRDLKYFLYSMKEYFGIERLLEKFVFSDKTINRLKDLFSYKYIDFESINSYLETKDIILSKVKPSRDIIKIITNRYDVDILKNIFKVYINLCKYLTYDELYYIDYDNSGIDNHLKPSYISRINNNYNKVVCFEFIQIFGYFLNTLGINYDVIGNQKSYGFEHESLVFRYQEFIIEIDVIQSVFESDFARAKIHDKLNGVRCLNRNISTNRKFQDILNSCYSIQNINYSKDFLPYQKVDNDISISGKIQEIVFKLDLIIKKLHNLNLQPGDEVFYLKKLLNDLFTIFELSNNISYCVLASGYNFCYIFSLNEVNYYNSNNLYLIYKDSKLSFIDKESLNNLLDNGFLNYLNKKEIPGLKVKKRD